MGSYKINRKKGKLEIVSDMKPAGDQPAAIANILDNFKSKHDHQVLLGVTGSGKTFTMANIIQKLNRPTIILAPNKTLAAQLFMEFKELFPKNAVEYFVSYYDYYQPEAYLPASNTFIEKDSSINDQIDRMKHAATMSLFEREDVIIVSSVSCIYGLGSPEEYLDMSFELESNSDYSRDKLLQKLVKVQYDRNDIDFHRGTFRVRGDVVEVFPPYEQNRVIRIEFFGDFIDKISWVDPLRGSSFENIDKIRIYPKSHYISSTDNSKRAMVTIREELLERINHYKDAIMLPQAERIEQRTSYDLELISEMGFCPGIENYSRHFTGRGAGEPPPTLLDYFPDDYLMIIDESHITVPQVGGMFKGDQSRKMTLVEHAFRLPSAIDNRPLNFPEFESLQNRVIYLSATPGEFEFKRCEGVITEQIIRPTGLVDPQIEIKPAKHQVDDLLDEIKIRVKKKERVLVTTLTKKMSEDLAEYYEGIGIKVKYLHSDIKTFERSEIIRDLRLGIFDVLIGINLLREGLDIPEVSLVAILDADKEGFLRSERSLVQTIGRAARNSEGRVILYADKETNSMKQAIKETDRRRKIQEEHNKKHGITPKTIQKAVGAGIESLYSSQYSLEPSVVEASRKGYQLRDLGKQIKSLKVKMKKAAEKLDFEEAAKLRDQLKRLEFAELSGLDGNLGGE